MSSGKAIEKQWMGLLTGISYQSGIDYYQNINAKYTEMMPARHCMSPNPNMLIASIDCDYYAKMLTDQEYEGVVTHLLQGVKRLDAGGADWLVLASNTAHMAVPAINKAYPRIPVLHIGDTTGCAVKAGGHSTVGLLGTAPTMREGYLKAQLAKHGIETLVPNNEADLDKIFDFIKNELSFGKFEDSTHQFFLDQIAKLVARGCSSVILGCTEIELLVSQEHVPNVPLFPSAALHIEAAAKVAAGKALVHDFQPTPVSLPLPMAPPPRTFSGEEVKRLLPMSDCVDAMEAALRAVSQPSLRMPVRTAMRLPMDELGIMGTMPVAMADYCACKVITVLPGNTAKGRHSHQGSVLLFETPTGHLLCTADGHEVSAVRTAAASAAATRVLARGDSHVLALLGTGTQAHKHLEAMLLVRDITQVNVWNRNLEKAQAFAAAAPCSAVAFADAKSAVHEADIICTLTPATAPILQGSWLKPGCHINAVGSCSPMHRELDLEVLLRSHCFVDSLAACLEEPGDLVVPLKNGELKPEQLKEIGSVLRQEIEGRTKREDITLFKSVGCAVEDLEAVKLLASVG